MPSDERNRVLSQLVQIGAKGLEQQRALEIPPPQRLDAFGRDLAAEQRWNREQFDKAGIDQVRLWYARVQPKDDPLRFKWMEEWLAEQERALREAEQKRVNRHELVTRWIAGIALAVSLAAWLFPRH